jgi:hypothetical protein
MRSSTAGGRSGGSGRWILAADVARFIVGWILFFSGVVMIVEAILGSLPVGSYFLWNVNRPLEFIVGLIAVTVGLSTIGGMSKIPLRPRRVPP